MKSFQPIPAPPTSEKSVGPRCCPSCGRGAGSSNRGECVSPMSCPCHKAQRIARVKALNAHRLAKPPEAI